MRRMVMVGAVVALVLALPMSAVADTIFRLDTPQEGATVFGLVEVAGWVADDGQECGTPPAWEACEETIALVSKIDLFIDNIYVASADLNQARFDVLQAYPWYAGSPYARPGFSTSFDASALTNGAHSLFVRVTFSDMTTTDYGNRTFQVNKSINQAPFGELELPGLNQPMNGVFPVTGWALDDSGISTIEIMVDGLVIGSAVSGIHRPDIGNRFPSHPGSDFAGFIRMLNTTDFTNGVHSISVRLRDNEGASRVIGYRNVQTFNTGYNLPPFGGIDLPIPNHIMFARGCTDPGGYSTPPYDDPKVVELITGWVLDVGARTDLGGVSWVQLLIDGSILSDTITGSDYWPWLEIDVNYLGQERLDIQRLFPDVPGSKDAGFAFRIDVSDLILRKGFRQGLHYLKVRAGDLEGNVADIAQVPVIFDCDDDPDRPSFGDIYAPDTMEMVSGVFQVSGWAIDEDRIDDAEVWLDGEFIDFVDEWGVDTPEIQARYPWYPTNITARAGFRYDFDTVGLNITDGEHILVIRTRDFWGGETIIGERAIVVDNPSRGVPASSVTPEILVAR